jgi:ribose-phosphate pyrophosphokinase
MVVITCSDAIWREARGAGRITAIVPFFGYGRADRRHGRREPIMARVVADLRQGLGIDHVVTVDLHTPHRSRAAIMFLWRAYDRGNALPLRGRLPRDLVVVSPGVGHGAMATRCAEWCLEARSLCFASDA